MTTGTAGAPHGRQHRTGFTLIELLIVVVIIGILAAVAIPRFDSFRQEAHFTSILNDFRNLGAAQERYYQLNHAYAADLDEVDFSLTSGVALTVTEASVSGWAAVGTHEALDESQGCAIYLGRADAPALPNGVAMSAAAGLPECVD